LRLARGLTLVELLVVLVILAALATVAISSTELLVDQSRYDTTTRTLDAIEEAVLGPPGRRGPDGGASVSGFVADVGRLPQVPNPDPGVAGRLGELWAQGALPSFGIATPAGDGDVRVPGGWRGPYLRLPLGASALADGWGRPYVARVEGSGADATTPGTAVGAVGNLGADGAAGGASYDLDVEVAFVRTTAPTLQRTRGALAVRVTPRSPGPGEYVVVRVYGPVDGVVQTIAEQHVAAPDETPIALPTAFDLAIGPRVVRAYQTTTLPATPESPIVATRRSAVTTVTIVAGGLPELSLDLGGP